MTKHLFLVMFCALSLALYAQKNSVVDKQELEKLKKEMTTVEKPSGDTLQWKFGGLVSANFSQAAFSNWAGGGQDAISLNTLLYLFAHHFGEHHIWENHLRIGYGFLTQEETGFRKTDDKIEFISKYGLDAFRHWFYSGLFRFRTQLAPGYNYPNDSDKISDFLSPAYITAAIGMNFKPDFPLALFLSPFTGKITIVQDQQLADAGAYGVEPAAYDSNGNKIRDGKNLRGEFGGSLQLNFAIDLMENVRYSTVLNLFSNYLHNPQNIDVLWDNLLSFKINKYLSAVISVNIVYDDDIRIAVDEDGDGTIDATGPRTQIKEVLSLGFSYQF